MQRHRSTQESALGRHVAKMLCFATLLCTRKRSMESILETSKHGQHQPDTDRTSFWIGFSVQRVSSRRFSDMHGHAQLYARRGKQTFSRCFAVNQRSAFSISTIMPLTRIAGSWSVDWPSLPIPRIGSDFRLGFVVSSILGP